MYFLYVTSVIQYISVSSPKGISESTPHPPPPPFRTIPPPPTPHKKIKTGSGKHADADADRKWRDNVVANHYNFRKMWENFLPLASHGPASKKASPGDHIDSDWSFSARDAKDKIKQVTPTTVIPTARRTSPFLILCHKNIDSSLKFCPQILSRYTECCLLLTSDLDESIHNFWGE